MTFRDSPLKKRNWIYTINCFRSRLKKLIENRAGQKFRLR